MADNMEVIISAIDEASEVFSTIASSCEEMMSDITSSATEASEGIDEIGIAADDIESSISDIDSSNIEDVGNAASDAAGGVDGLGDALGGASDAADQLGNSMGVIEGSMLLGAAEQIGKLAGNTEGMAQEMNNASIAVGQLATNVGMAEPQMVDLINNISNATFPQSEAMAYVNALNQMGVSANQLGSAATNMDRINDATHIGYEASIQLTQGLQSVGISADQLPTAFNAIAYAQDNVTGGAQTMSTVFKRQAATINEYGLSADQVVLIMQKLSEQGVQGMKMGSELSNVLKENNGDISAIEKSLGMQSGALENAAEATGAYEGQLQKLANEEAEHKTILDQIGAAWEDVTLKLSGVLSPAASAVSAIGEVGSLGMSIKGIKELSTTFTQLKETKYGIAAANYAQAASEGVLSAATSAYGTVVAVLTGEIGLAEAATMAWNAVLAMNPLALVAIAAVALAVAVYEVGKAFGWWTDVGSMIDAIWAGIQRLWNAFINHPDVQSFLSVLSTAWNILSNAVGRAVSWVMSFFQTNNSGNFDIVRALIDGIGIAWQIITTPIRNVITVIKLLWTTMRTAGTNIRGVINNIRTWFAQLPGRIRSAISTLVSIITAPFKNAYSGVTKAVDDIKNYVSGIPGAVSGALSGLANTITKPFSDAYNRIVKVVDDIKAKAKQIPVIGGAFGGPELAYGGLDLLDSPNYTSTNNDNLKVDITQDINMVLDLRNVPSGMDENMLKSALNETVQSKEFIQQLVNNSDFQSLDQKVKARISARNNRARGV